uniref:Fe2OG dioxygenase domain-containing protein n=1 Tax=Phaeomonas parva TaxID=124430 RepID=A0A6U4ESQ5_9STRA|eukprot:CAMPEP_0118876918 /NCGR_PEP_ID=MMETSP1163-20130328/17409_1 /TAXON_ID=124430 /ORGANISM="Phaeomonas parva, Strain CCMP2877" /LENGTH=376 /DNA_ID=CAMNT_0006812573 /DNA_START=82 /DNA_END=1212 /DNA_ORIENTATION=-
MASFAADTAEAAAATAVPVEPPVEVKVFEVNSRVRAHWRGLKALYGAVVTARHEVETHDLLAHGPSYVYDLLYDEGDEEFGVSPSIMFTETESLVQTVNQRKEVKKNPKLNPRTASANAIRRFLKSVKLPRHAVHEAVFPRERMDDIFEKIQAAFDPHVFSTVNYTDWKISSYAECFQKTNPQPPENPAMLEALMPLLEKADEILIAEHCRRHREYHRDQLNFKRMHSFVTRYLPNPADCGLPLHIDGVSVEGSIIMGLPTPEPFNGGGVSVWDDAKIKTDVPNVEEVFYPMNPGDTMYLDKMVWHQANDITAGQRWALVIFYKIRPKEEVLQAEQARAAQEEQGQHGEETSEAQSPAEQPEQPEQPETEDAEGSA